MAQVLIADAASFMRMRGATLLRELGHEVLEAASGEQAVALYREHAPDAVLLDVAMSASDGLETLREIMAIDAGARVAMVSATGQQPLVMESIQSGARDFVVKPFDAARLEEALAKLTAA